MNETIQREDIIFSLPPASMPAWQGPFLGAYYYRRDSENIMNPTSSIQIYAMLVEHPNA